MNRPAQARSSYTVSFGATPPRRATHRDTGRIPRVARMLALAHRIDGMIRNGDLRDLADAGRAIGFTREYQGDKNNRAEALFALDYQWQPAERFHLRFSSELFTEMAPNSGEIRNLTIVEIRIMLKKQPNLNFVVGAENEYETVVKAGDKKNDLKYYLTLALGF